MWRLFLGLLLLVGLNPLIQAQMDKPVIPELLQPWQEWVLYDYQPENCPSIYNQINQQRICAWPSALSLSLHQTGGDFQQVWLVQQDSWIYLPGNAEHWPLNVTVNNQPVPVARRDQQPAVYLTPGQYQVGGEFDWKKLPEKLRIPQEIARVQLTIDQQPIDFPDHHSGFLLLHEQNQQAVPAQENHHSLSVFRKITDDIPLTMETMIALNVSGEARELTLGPVLLPDTLPLSVQSPLPLKIENNGSVLLQVRPGQWKIKVTTRFHGPVKQITLPPSGENWVNEEVWVFDARPQLRQVTLEGLSQINPARTRLPAAWKNLPAYRIQPGQTLTLQLQQRGNPDPAANQLQLNRKLWLDFDGQGFTIADTIQGRMHQQWRLEMAAPFELGRVSIHGDDQVITHIAERHLAGVEIRTTELKLQAESRLEQSQLLSLGWQADFNSAQGELLLPPGYTLIDINGVDQVSRSWIKQWSLLDIFLVLIITLIIHRLWSWKTAAVAAVVLVLTWHEPYTPGIPWLVVVAVTALWRVLPQNRFKDSMNAFRILVLLALFLTFAEYAVNAVRNGLYPQLEQGRMTYADSAKAGRAELKASAPAVGHEANRMSEMADYAQEEMRQSILRKNAPPSSQDTLNQAIIDPGAKRQTGPGLPHWQWQRVQFSWSGPVSPNQSMQIFMIPPQGQLGINIISVLLMGMLIMMLSGFNVKRIRQSSDRAFLRALGGGLVLLPMLMLLPDQAWAQTEPPSHTARLTEQADVSVPSPQLLAELKTRLIAHLEQPPACAPQCATMPQAVIQVKPAQLTVRLQVHVLTETAVPLPGKAGQWQADRVRLNQQPVRLLASFKHHTYLLLSPGVHQLELSGPLPSRASVQIPFPLNPMQVQTEADGWLVQGVDEKRLSGPLQLIRQQQTQELAYETVALPPLVKVERTITFGIDWQVKTTVTRLSSQNSPVSLQIPLLPGESVLTEDRQVKQGKIQVALAAGQSTFHWLSSLEKTEQLVLKAADNQHWLEHWRLSVSPIWRIDTQGLVEILHQSNRGEWIPEWRPWPAEQLVVNITRPEGVEGATLTVDQSRMTVKPGNRVSDIRYQMTLRSSHGELRELKLPETAQLQSLQIDGRAQPIPADQQTLRLMVPPGSHQIKVHWLQQQPIGLYYQTPGIETGMQSVNNHLGMTLPQDRWILFAGGPQMGPAVLFWGVLLVIVLIAAALGRSGYTPLKTWQWILLGIGLSQIPIWMAAVVASWFFVIAWRRQHPPAATAQFNLLQTGIIALTMISAVFLVFAVWQGLLGSPDMQISGNGSYHNQLNWYQDRSDNQYPQAWVVSLPLFVYRLFMLFWSLWLAFSLLKWVQWGWQGFSTDGLWKQTKKEIDTIEIDPPKRAD